MLVVKSSDYEVLGFDEEMKFWKLKGITYTEFRFTPSVKVLSADDKVFIYHPSGRVTERQIVKR